MTDNQYQELVEFLAQRFDAIDGRFDALEGRTAAVEVGLESLRGEVRLVAEGVTTNGVRLDRLETSVIALHGRFERAEQRTLARHDDHEERIQAIEDRRWRRRPSFSRRQDLRPPHRPSPSFHRRHGRSAGPGRSRLRWNVRLPVAVKVEDRLR